MDWLEWEHGFVVRRSLKRAWPSGVQTVLNVGADGMVWTEWLAKEFDCSVNVVALSAEWLQPFTGEFPESPVSLYDLAVFVNTLTRYREWEKVVRWAATWAKRVLVFDNLMSPAPAWSRANPHRTCIEYPELEAVAATAGLRRVAAFGADRWHRRLFLGSPRVLHPVIAGVTLGLDLLSSMALDPAHARHSAFVFVRAKGG